MSDQELKSAGLIVRDQILVGVPGEFEDELRNLAKYGSTTAIIVLCDSHLIKSHADSDESETDRTARHTYYIYDLQAFEVFAKYVEMFRKALSLYLNDAGISVCATWQSVNIIRVQLVFGSETSAVRPGFAMVLATKILELKNGG